MTLTVGARGGHANGTGVRGNETQTQKPNVSGRVVRKSAVRDIPGSFWAGFDSRGEELFGAEFDDERDVSFGEGLSRLVNSETRIESPDVTI